MSPQIRLLFVLALCAKLVHSADAPDGTAFSHNVLSVDGAELLRIRYCGVPLQLRLASIQYKSAESEKDALSYLKETLKPGTAVRFELEAEQNADAPAPALAQVFAGATHLNVELVKRGLAVSDGRSRKFGSTLLSAQTEAVNKKLGMWRGKNEPAVAAAPEKPKSAPPIISEQDPPPPVISSSPVRTQASFAEPEIAPPGYNGSVVADLTGKEYHFPGSRYARNIRPQARIEYRSADEAERAGKSPSPFSLPDRAREVAARQQRDTAARGGSSSASIVEDAKKAYREALVFMQEARKLSRSNNAAANDNWKKASRLLTEHIDRVLPVSDADPNNRDLQKLTEDMSMSLYSCKKYQSL